MPTERRPPSLTLRLTLLFGVVAIIVFLGFGWFIENSIKHHFHEEDAKELSLIVQAVEAPLLARSDDRDIAMMARRFNDILIGHHGASMYISGPNGHTLFSSAGPDLSPLTQTTESRRYTDLIYEWRSNDHFFRVLVRSVRAAGAPDNAAYTVAVALPIDYHLSFLKGFRHTLWLMVASGFGITALMGWFAVRYGHAPLRHIISRIRRTGADAVNTRLEPESVPRELTDLVVSFNEMLDRVEASFRRLSNFSADIAHDLRTPITAMMTQTQVALSQPRNAEEYRDILYSNMEEYERIARMINDMLFLAKTDNELEVLNIADVDLARETGNLFEYYEAWADERGVKLTLEGTATVKGNALMLRRALSNLLSNAIRHTHPGAGVNVTLVSSDRDAVCIDIDNPGPGISSEHLPKLFDRFYRVDPSRQEGGAGLGLAIVKSIVDAHKGEITVASGPDRTRFSIVLPTASTRR